MTAPQPPLAAPPQLPLAAPPLLHSPVSGWRVSSSQAGNATECDALKAASRASCLVPSLNRLNLLPVMAILMGDERVTITNGGRRLCLMGDNHSVIIESVNLMGDERVTESIFGDVSI